MEINYKDIMDSFNEDFRRCLKAITYIEDCAMYNHRDDPYDEENDYEKAMLEYTLKKIFNKLILIYDSLSLKKMLELLESEFNPFKNKLTELRYYSYIGELGSEPYGILSDHYDQLRLLLNISKDKDLTNRYEYLKVKSILKSTPKIIHDSSNTPESESDVKKEIRRVLSYFFPDTVAEIPIPKSVKTFKPDIGIKSLKLAIEYKYANNEKEVKSCVGGILEDIGGYSGSEDWKKFIAVIYMTEAVFSEEQIEALFKESSLPSNWTIMCVYGKGERKKKKALAPKVKKASKKTGASGYLVENR